ncbi:hypothetical protein PFISCL1PPCAC_25910, partial [Pristionchus fissidentatus]
RSCRISLFLVKTRVVHGSRTPSCSGCQPKWGFIDNLLRKLSKIQKKCFIQTVAYLHIVVMLIACAVIYFTKFRVPGVLEMGANTLKYHPRWFFISIFAVSTSILIAGAVGIFTNHRLMTNVLILFMGTVCSLN